ncbi:MAG TPA: MarR family transcriptional regulator [Solirubrobacteraceae bacterium]|nr:MarR family transcriptional regulator [Solirubrobacteraceae bacterium]
MQAAAPTLAAELDAHLIALWKAVGRVQHHDLSRTAASVLASLRDHGPLRVTALAASEAVAQPTMTTLVGRLERDGLVERGGDPADARAVLVTITAEGLERLLRIREARAAAIDARLQELDPDEREALAAALPALTKLAREVR